MGIHRLGLKVDNPTKLVATSVERGRGLNAGMNIDWYRHWFHRTNHIGMTRGRNMRALTRVHAW
jgi:hypothetical protein